MSLLDTAMQGFQGTAGQAPVRQGYNEAEGAITSGYKQAQEQIQPFVDFGKQGITSLASLIANPSSITQTPQYQFQLSEGLAAIQRQYGAQGKFFSGEGARSATKFAEGLASTSYQNQFQNLFNITQMGQQATEFQSGQSMTYGENLASLNAGEGRDLGQMQFDVMSTQKQHMHEAGLEAMQMTGSMSGGTSKKSGSNDSSD